MLCGARLYPLAQDDRPSCGGFSLDAALGRQFSASPNRQVKQILSSWGHLTSYCKHILGK